MGLTIHRRRRRVNSQERTIKPLKASVKAPQMRHRGVSKRYRRQDRVSGNRIRLWALVRLFRLSPSAIAKATGFSRPYVARLLSDRDEFSGSPEFFRTLECKLGQIIDGRSAQFFTCPGVSVARARNVLERWPVEQAAVDSEMARAA